MRSEALRNRRRRNREAAERERSLRREVVRWRQAEVTDDSPLSIVVGGATEPWSDVRRLASYTPTIGDQVAVLVRGGDVLVLGEIV